MSGFRLPLALSLAAHAVILTLLVLLPPPASPAAPPPAAGIEISFAPSLPQPPPAPQPVKAEPPPPPPPPPPPRPPPPKIAPPPPPPAPQAEVVVPERLPLPPPPKPPVPPRHEIVRRIERPIEHRERPRPNLAAVPPSPVERAFRMTPTPAAPAQQAALPPASFRPPAPYSAAVSPGYEALLGEWLNAHKRYPESARERGEEGRAVLHFAVERSGRVTEFAVVKSSGYADLDQGLEEMMRGASLPPFPADMRQSSISVSVTIRFSLER